MTNESGVQQVNGGIIAASHDRRLDVLERRINADVAAPTVKDRLTFSVFNPTVSTGGYDHLRYPLQLIRVVLLGDNTSALTGTYTVHILKNPLARSGDTALIPRSAGSADMVLGSGSGTPAEATYTFLEPFSGAEDSAHSDLCRFTLTTVGTGITTLTLKALFG